MHPAIRHLLDYFLAYSHDLPAPLVHPDGRTQKGQKASIDPAPCVRWGEDAQHVYYPLYPIGSRGRSAWLRVPLDLFDSSPLADGLEGCVLLNLNGMRREYEKFHRNADTKNLRRTA